MSYLSHNFSYYPLLIKIQFSSSLITSCQKFLSRRLSGQYELLLRYLATQIQTAPKLYPSINHVCFCSQWVLVPYHVPVMKHLPLPNLERLVQSAVNPKNLLRSMDLGRLLSNFLIFRACDPKKKKLELKPPKSVFEQN